MSYTKIMLINAVQPEEARAAVLSPLKDSKNYELVDLDIENPQKQLKKGNIYLGKVVNYEPSLEAAFIEYGGNRPGFLPLKEIPLELRESLQEGQEILVQIEKEERGSKGAALTSFISLAGCYLVLMPNNPRAGGISRRVANEERSELRESLSQLTLPEGMGVIIRTAGVSKNLDELQWDLNILLNHWEAILKVTREHKAPCLIHQESDVIIRALRDLLKKDVGQILVDEQETFEKIKAYLELVRPDSQNLVTLYNDPVPLFTRYQVESQIELAMQRTVRLPSGGSIVIDKTEALTAFDVNSAQSTKSENIENTALHTNLEAAEAVATQLRLRDIGGLVVIDFIDMQQGENRRRVENRLREALKLDRARIQVGEISRFGILEMSRQRLRPTLREQTHAICPHCEGVGTIRTVKSLALSVLRMIEETVLQKNVIGVQVQAPLELAAFLANEKREFLLNLEQRWDAKILIIPNQNMNMPKFEVRPITSEAGVESVEDSPGKYSYSLVNKEGALSYQDLDKRRGVEEPILKQMKVPGKKVKGSLLKKIWQALFVARSESTAATTATQATPASPAAPGMKRHQRGGKHVHAKYPRREGQQGHKPRQQHSSSSESGREAPAMTGREAPHAEKEFVPKQPKKIVEPVVEVVAPIYPLSQPTPPSTSPETSEQLRMVSEESLLLEKNELTTEQAGNANKRYPYKRQRRHDRRRKPKSGNRKRTEGGEVEGAGSDHIESSSHDTGAGESSNPEKTNQE